MKFTLSWLKDHLETEAGVQAIADKLTSIGLEVESVEDAGARLAEFTVAHVVSAERHPNADRLKLCMVDTGAGGPVQVVCGAPNARAGMKAIFARPGTTIPATGVELKVGTIRGVESHGMLCSGRELLISDDQEGIIELSADAAVGAAAASALGLSDPIIDVSITPNRGDCTGVWGIARDLAAAGLGKLKTPRVPPIKGKFPAPQKIRLEAPDACPLYASRMVRGVKNGASPQWVQQRLRAVGMRPISALVDMTNYISLDRGRPLHVFDSDKLKGEVVVRMAKDGETMLALDGRRYVLDSSMCIIADDNGATDLGGIMGGEDSGCSNETINVLIEAAYFDPKRTAKTGRKLGIVSDARYRFERGVDPEFVLPALELATKLILEWCGGEPAENHVAGAVPKWRHTVSFPLSEVKRLAGIEVPKAQIAHTLNNLGFETKDGDPMEVTPPSWRHDIEGKADLVEEVVRIRGLDNIPPAAMTRPHAVARAVLTPAQRRIRAVKRTLAARGFNECINFTFIPRAQATIFGGGDDSRELENPIAADLDSMRPSVLPSLLAAAQRNQARGFTDLMLCEVGAQFASGTPGDQQTVAAGIRVGDGARSWSKSAHAADAFDAKSDMLAVLEAATGTPMTAPVKPGAPSWYHPGRSGVLALGPKPLGYFGEIHPALLAAFDLKGPVSMFEVVLDAVPEHKTKGRARAQFAPSPYPAVERDFAFVVDADVSAEDLLKAIRGTDRNLIERTDLFDVYEGKGVPDGKKSVAISVRLQPRDKTLTDAEIETVAAKIVAAVTKTTGGTLRT